MRRVTRGITGTIYAVMIALMWGCSPGAKETPQEKPTTGLYGGILSDSQVNTRVTAERELVFPKDHLPHTEHAIEWWYFTTNLHNPDRPEQMYALQYTLFRFNQGNSRENAWSDGQLYMGHLSIHTPLGHVFEERFARTGLAHAGVFSQPFTIRMDDWVWRSHSEALLPARLSVSSQGVDVDLTLSSAGPLVLHGQDGYSQKSASGSHASYYYSQPFIKVTGHIQEAGKTSKLVGDGWFDHEWTSQLIDASTAGWDWLSMHLDSGHKVMVFRMRLNEQPPHYYASYIEPSGTLRSLVPDQFSFVPIVQSHFKGRDFPSEWSLEIPELKIDITTKPQKQQQWNLGRFEYYEGAIDITGTHSGVGFMELTGY